MIVSIKDRLTEAILRSAQCPKGFPADLFRSAKRKLNLLDLAEELNDLRSPPGNRLEVLGGDRRGQYSIRINGQWRVCFRWTAAGAGDVEIVDYH
ncbi:MAG: type II toxin-antitoxin system RelE/ParE family toxin [Devosia sp.]